LVHQSVAVLDQATDLPFLVDLLWGEQLPEDGSQDVVFEAFEWIADRSTIFVIGMATADPDALLDRPAKVVDVGLRIVVVESKKRPQGISRGDVRQSSHPHCMLGNGVVFRGRASEAAGHGQVVGDVLEAHVFRARAERVESRSGEGVAAGGAHGFLQRGARPTAMAHPNRMMVMVVASTQAGIRRHPRTGRFAP
jgi:hypothetical protein